MPLAVALPQFSSSSIKDFAGQAMPLLATIELFDLFDGKSAENIGAGRKSLAYSLTYLDKNRTLTSDEVSAAHDRIRERLQSELGVELRE